VPPRTSRRHRQGAESRERILDAALEIAAERGYDGTTIALVCQATGLPASSVYWHFTNKDALLAEVLEHSYSRWRAGEEAFEAADGGDLHERFAARFERVRLGLVEQPEFWRLGLRLSLLSGPDEIAARTRFLQVRQQTVDATVGWCVDALGAPALARHPALPELLTQLLMAAGDGFFMAVQSDRHWDFDRLTTELGAATGEIAARRADAPRSRARRRTPAPVAWAPRPQPADSRERLLAGAAEVAAERGYVGTTISRVCARSGLPVSSVYWFFEDKDALLAEVVQHSFAEWAARQPTWEPTDSAEGRAAALRAVLRRTTRSFADTPDFLRIGHLMALEQQDEETAARALFLRIRRDVEGQLSGWFAGTLADSPASGDRALPALLARLVIALTDGLFLAEQVDSWAWDFDAITDLVVDVLESVVASREAAAPRRQRVRQDA
jgi:AcrR family transcriptional regulator